MSTAPVTSISGVTSSAGIASTLRARSICSAVRPSCASCCGSIVAASASASALGLPVTAVSLDITLATSSAASAVVIPAASNSLARGTSARSLAIVCCALTASAGACPTSAPIRPASRCASDTVTTSCLVTISSGLSNAVERSSVVLGIPTVSSAVCAVDTPARACVTLTCC